MEMVSRILFILAACIITISLLQKNSNFLDIRLIIKQHFEVFKGSPLQLITIFITPMLLSIGTVIFKSIDKDIVNNINIVLSILISMFFAMLSILCSLNQKEKSIPGKNYNKLLSETFNAILFESLICILLLVVSFIQLFINDFTSSLALKICSAIIYYLMLVIILNIFVIIKRIKVLFENK